TDRRATVVCFRGELQRAAGSMVAARHSRAEADDRRGRSQTGQEQNDHQSEPLAIHLRRGDEQHSFQLDGRDHEKIPTDRKPHSAWPRQAWDECGRRRASPSTATGREPARSRWRCGTGSLRARRVGGVVGGGGGGSGGAYGVGDGCKASLITRARRRPPIRSCSSATSALLSMYVSSRSVPSATTTSWAILCDCSAQSSVVPPASV